MPTSAILTDSRRNGFTLLEVLMSLLIIAVLAAFLSRILQSSLLSHQQIRDEIHSAPAREQAFHRQLSVETEDPVVELFPVDEEEN